MKFLINFKIFLELEVFVVNIIILYLISLLNSV